MKIQNLPAANQILRIGFKVVLFALLIGCNKQNRTAGQDATNDTNRVGGDCEAGYCELMYLAMPKEMNSVDTSAGWFEQGQKLLVTGTVFQSDGTTPAPGVILYYHQTDNNGYYSPGDGKPENSTRHGHIRGWVKTGEDGKYWIYTIRPAPYPNENLPAHIHWMIKEPDINNEYWVDDVVFEDDPLLIPYSRKHPFENRSGSGIVTVTTKDDVQIARHDFVLGLNIPNYPKK